MPRQYSSVLKEYKPLIHQTRNGTKVLSIRVDETYTPIIRMFSKDANGQKIIQMKLNIMELSYLKAVIEDVISNFFTTNPPQNVDFGKNVTTPQYPKQ